MHDVTLWQGDMITPTANYCNWRHPIYIQCCPVWWLKHHLITEPASPCCSPFLFLKIIFSHTLLLWSFINFSILLKGRHDYTYFITVSDVIVFARHWYHHELTNCLSSLSMIKIQISLRFSYLKEGIPDHDAPG